MAGSVVVKPDDMHLVPRNHKVKEENLQAAL